LDIRSEKTGKKRKIECRQGGKLKSRPGAEKQGKGQRGGEKSEQKKESRAKENVKQNRRTLEKIHGELKKDQKLEKGARLFRCPKGKRRKER